MRINTIRGPFAVFGNQTQPRLFVIFAYRDVSYDSELLVTKSVKNNTKPSLTQHASILVGFGVQTDPN